MQIFIIIALIIAILAVIFALENLPVVTVTLLLWNVKSSLALVLLISLAVGVLISLMASLPGLIRSRLTISSQKKKLAALETERNTFKQKADESGNEISTLEEQLASLSAELDKYHRADAASQPDTSTPAAPTTPASPAVPSADSSASIPTTPASQA